jgi:dTDP-4-amino-4,6-dideoxygalactose transaminase
MAIFNSLGSNYNFQYVIKSLFSDSYGRSLKLKNYLTDKYRGKVILTYKGREALTLALKILNLPKESCIAINGFTCFTVYRSIETAGYTPICLDLEKENTDLNFSSEILKKTLLENEKIKAVVIQNTLGYSCDMDNIKKICTEKNIILIEDLAHCVGTKYENKQEAGTVGDIIALTFSQDKVIDAVSGGALIIRNKKYLNGDNFQLKKPKGQLRDKMYPLLTYKIRILYSYGLGKILHFILKKLDLLSKPMRKGLYNLYSLPDWYCNLTLFEFRKLNQQLNHRKEIARIYAKKISKKILNSNINSKISTSSNLRFPIFVEDRGDLIKFLKKDKIFVSDIWYFDVAPECPNAVKVSKKILNLPTHININKEDALKISERINKWLKS